MGRSQGVVFGFGAIIKISDFVAKYPNTFEYDENSKDWSSTDELDEIFDSEGRAESNISEGIKLFYCEMESDIVFIATEHSTVYPFEKGYIWHPFVDIDMDAIDQEKEIVETWLYKEFPHSEIGFKMYGYYVG